jgi:hypothetical protein
MVVYWKFGDNSGPISGFKAIRRKQRGAKIIDAFVARGIRLLDCQPILEKTAKETRSKVQAI